MLANLNSRIFPPDSQPYGKSYSEWVGAFWKWLLEYPLPDNPALEQPNPFDLSARQSGQVWFWAAPDFGERIATLPAGKALFLTLRDVECSSLEPEESGFHGDTEAEQKECADLQYGLPTDGSADYSDSDGDLMNNWREWRAGTIPTDALSALRLLNPSNNASGVTVSWQSVSTRTYFLERALNLGAAPPFSLLTSNVAGLPGVTSYTDTNAIDSSPYFYRVGVQ